MTKQGSDEIRTGYDRAANAYAEKFLRELEQKQFDRDCLTEFATRYADRPHEVIDVGCGTGQTTGFLSELGVKATGIDLSPEMIAVAKASFRGAAFEVGDMFQLNRTDESIGGILAFYAIVNNPPADLLRLFAELVRVLCNGGQLLLAFHHGEGEVVQDDFLGSGARLVFYYHQAEQVGELLTSVGMVPERVTVREPYSTEYPSQRGYILATKRPTKV